MAHDKILFAPSSEARHILRKTNRQTLRDARSSMSAQSVEKHSLAIAQRAYPLVSGAHRLAGYFALGAEADVSPILERCRNNAQLTYAPLVKQGNTMSFVPFDENTQITVNRYGIKEPVVSESDHRQPAQLDAVLVPLVGFDSQCNRMGMGGGYYDRSFSHRRTTAGKPLLIGVAFDLQGVDSVHADWWDVPMDYIVTETRIIRRISADA